MTQTEFEQILIRIRPRMLMVADDFFHCVEDAEDVIQEVYVRMLKRGWHEGDNVEALAIKATKNLCVSVWRRQRLRSTEQIEKIPEPAVNDTADGALLHKERQIEIESAIEKLTPSEQRLIRMRQLEEMSLEQISRETGMTRGSASAIVSAAKKRLFKILKSNNT